MSEHGLSDADVAALEAALHAHLWGLEMAPDEAVCCVETILPIVGRIRDDAVNEANKRADDDSVGGIMRRRLSRAQEAEQTLRRHQAARAVGLLPCPCGCGAIAAPHTAPLTPEQPPADHGDGSGAGGREGGEGA